MHVQARSSEDNYLGQGGDGEQCWCRLGSVQPAQLHMEGNVRSLCQSVLPCKE